jgi:FAD/FMN-containing dehydrogenase/Fe-S oxidoreductase
MMKTQAINVKALVNELKNKIEGEVRFDDGSRALYATDGSNYRQVPIGVVIPKTIEDVIHTVALCQKYGAPLLSRGGGTSLAGQCCNVAVVMDFSKYLNKVIEIDPVKKIARVQPGCVLDTLREAAEKYQLTFGPDPSTHNHNTLGGMIGNDSCGVHSVLAAFEGEGGRTADNVEALEILTYDGIRMHVGKTSEAELEKLINEGGGRGEIYRKLKVIRDKYSDQIRKKYPNIPRRVSGYNLDDLLPEHNFNVAKALVGSEGTCVVILEATVNLIYSPPVRSLVVLGYEDIFMAGDHIMEIMAHRPSGLEGMDDLLIDYMKKKKMHPEDVQLLPKGKGWLLVEFGGKNKQESDEKAQNLMQDLQQKDKSAPTMKLIDDKAEEKQIWLVRESGLGATANVPGEPSTWPGWEDSAVPPEKVGEYLRQLKALFKKYHYKASVYGHFGQGCIHCRIPFDLVTAKGIQQFRSFLGEAAKLVVSFGGSLSGEHGDGQARAELLPIMFGDELVEAFREFKSIWDPQWKMNPGKVVDPYSITENLRIGTSYNPWEPQTHFHFPDDAGSFSKATLRCVGVGNCRRSKGGTMCPSYMVTKEEKYSTRGRSRLLFEMLNGGVIGKNKWRDKAVKEALDLCLACKGCKGDCPVNVDMASYKAEFLSHFYHHRIRPRSAYAFGFINRWSRIAAIAPGFFNFFTQTIGFKSISKFIVGMAPQREVPKFAKQTFQDWFKCREIKNVSKPKVILWPDTFCNYFHPEIAIAAVDVLEYLGFQVTVPKHPVCCGRPFYDYGFLKQAKEYLQKILDNFQADIREGTPVIGLEPTCVAVFRDELGNLFPHNEDAYRLKKQTFLFSEFIQTHCKDSPMPNLNCKALVHGHCHQKAIIGMEDDKEIMQRLGLDFQILDSGCCGMAGSFGYEKGEHYAVSVKAGERVLFPAIENSTQDTLIISNGFSCRTHILDRTKRSVLHLAEVIQLALQNSEGGNAKT